MRIDPSQLPPAYRAQIAGIAPTKAPKPRGMNKWESEYAKKLEALKAAGVVRWYGFERITLKLAHDTRYTPDFLVWFVNGDFQCHEVKGHWRDDALVKIKVAADLFRMFRFIAVRLEGGAWQSRIFLPDGDHRG